TTAPRLPAADPRAVPRPLSVGEPQLPRLDVRPTTAAAPSLAPHAPEGRAGRAPRQEGARGVGWDAAPPRPGCCVHPRSHAGVPRRTDGGHRPDPAERVLGAVPRD